ncbi:P-loop containing nucleoside triphosphate hydrolase protein [Periconia macrospinosa]|uniref:P-loop containing nucleoside triphosphate hydrolase protein n=1 Tax=Periconia macrospinosa TaxID=97972 RepID=A0A2V1EDN1_9PLEO|nr:P-loop containing nucleoside triphosphate hydrolase protein [Periconia macrospinosa]
MTDLLQVLPDFDTRPYTHLLPSLDKAFIATNDLTTLEPQHVAKRAHLPVPDVRKLQDAVVRALHLHLGFGGEEAAANTFWPASPQHALAADHAYPSISTLDDKFDDALLGGIRPGYLVEVTGERLVLPPTKLYMLCLSSNTISGAGKTQFLLTLLLASQLPPPKGLAKSAIYISTEAALATTRLTQLLATHPSLASLPPKVKPSLSRILSIQTPDLEAQEHILRYQLPVAIKKHNVGLVVLDSVAANFRAEFDKDGARNGVASLGKRSVQLVQLGALLRDLARTEGLAIVVANQVADRFTGASNAPSNLPSRSTSANSQSNSLDHSRHVTPQPPADGQSMRPEGGLVLSPNPLTLDHQQCWFTGWGDIQSDPSHTLKTPSLGLVWTNQIACRIALIKKPVLSSRPLVVTVNGKEEWNEEESSILKWRRWFKVVFAPWAPPSQGRGVEYEVLQSGVSHISTK